MKNMLVPFALAFCVWLGLGEALAENAAPVSQTASVPDLTGTWTGPFKVIRAHGVNEGTIKLHVTEQDGPLIKGVKSWETSADVTGVDVQRATAPMVGVVDFDGKTLYFTMVGDDGINIARLDAPDTLKVVYVEAGYATALRAELTRKK